MKKFALTLILMLISGVLWACPNCHPIESGNKPPYTLIILGVFILVTYIPFYLLFSAAKKYDPKNATTEE
jgi:hypothetical protein